MSRRQPEGTRLISGGDERPDAYTYGAIKREPLLPSPRKYLWAKRDFVLISAALITALVIIVVSLSLGLPRITVNRSRQPPTSVSPSASPLPLLEQAAFETTESSGVTIEKYIGALVRSGRLNFQISPF